MPHPPGASPAPKHLTLFRLEYCGYCVDVQNELKRLGIAAEQVSLRRHPEAEAELLRALGRSTVPVLRIEEADGSVRYLPESLDIIRYLRSLAPGQHGLPLFLLSALRGLPWLLLGAALLLSGPSRPWFAGAAAALWAFRFLRGKVLRARE